VAGQPLASLPQAVHLAPMLSLEAVTFEADVARFLHRLPGRALVAEPKIDGLSIEVVCEDGTSSALPRAATTSVARR